MSIAIEYAQPLRAIGQALEALKIENFELRPDGDDFIVRGLINSPQVETADTKSRDLRFSREGGRGLDESADEPMVEGHRIDLCYSLKDVERLERDGQRRRGTGSQVARGESISQLLRAIGAYLEEKPARLVRLARTQKSVVVVYETLAGVKFEEKLDGGTLREWEAQMSVKRAAREIH